MPIPLQVNVFLSLAISFTIVYFVIPKIIKVSTTKSLFDVPNHRSAASQAVPTLGGISILAGFTIGLIISSNNFNIDELKHLIAGILVMFVIGLKDDIIGLSAKKKLIIEIVMALYLIIAGHYRITNLHGIFGINEIGFVTGTILSLVTIVGIINAINLIDGIDGLASGVCLLISLIYGTFFLMAHDFIYALTCFSLSGSLVAFFLYNVFGTKNKIFMGDTGSLILGTIIAVLIIHFNEIKPEPTPFAFGLPAISLAIVIVPVIDTLRVIAIRIIQKKSPFAPDMNHIHHNLLKLTSSHLKSSLIIITTNGLIFLFAFFMIDTLGGNYLFMLLLISGFILANVPAWILSNQGQSETKGNEPQSILAFSIFQKKEKDKHLPDKKS